jgi:hypothetical protein
VFFKSFLVVFSLQVVACYAEQSVENEDTAQLNKLIEQVETYMNNVHFFVSNFTQTKVARNGAQESESGKMYVEKGQKTPCKIRFDFAKTLRQIFVLKDTMVIKNKDNTIKAVNLKSTPIVYIFGGNLKIRQHFEVTNLGGSSDIIFLQMKPKFLKSASVTLFFKIYKTGNIERFVGWSVSDGSGSTVHVKLDDMVVNDAKALPQNAFDVGEVSKKNRTKVEQK